MSKASNPCALYGMLSPLIEKPDRKRATVDAICFFVSALAAAALFILVMQLNLLGAEKQDYQVDYASCSCDCWDRQFKGNYHDFGYKSVYFQLTQQAAAVFIWTVLYLACLLKFLERLVPALFGSLGLGRLIGLCRAQELPRIRWGVLIGSAFNLFGSFYNHWCTFNYLNDRPPDRAVNRLFYTQTYFNLTEIIPAAGLYYLLLKGSKPSSSFLLWGISTSLAHLYLSLADQGWAHLVSIHPYLLRDVTFLASDLGGLIPLCWHLGRSKAWDHKIRLVGLTVMQLAVYGCVKTLAGYDQI